MIQIACDHCGKILAENNKTVNDWREIRIEIFRGDVKEALVYHICYDHCLNAFKDHLKRFMSE